jgi:hypothetical protein
MLKRWWRQWWGQAGVAAAAAVLIGLLLIRPIQLWIAIVSVCFMVGWCVMAGLERKRAASYRALYLEAQKMAEERGQLLARELRRP